MQGDVFYNIDKDSVGAVEEFFNKEGDDMKSWSGLFLFLLAMVCFFGCAKPPVESKVMVGEKTIIVPEKALEGAPKSKVYKGSAEEVRQSVVNALRKQGFTDLKEGILRDEISTEKLKVENPNQADASEDVLKTLAKEHIKFQHAGKLVVVSCEVSFSKVVGSAYRTNQSYPMTESVIRGDFFQKLDAELNLELSENSK